MSRFDVVVIFEIFLPPPYFVCATVSNKRPYHLKFANISFEAATSSLVLLIGLNNVQWRVRIISKNNYDR